MVRDHVKMLAFWCKMLQIHDIQIILTQLEIKKNVHFLYYSNEFSGTFLSSLTKAC